MERRGRNIELSDDDIPNLVSQGDEAELVYERFLATLGELEHREAIVFACRRIRSFYAGDHCATGIRVTNSFEVDALCSLRRFQEALDTLVEAEAAMYGAPLDLDQPEFGAEETYRILTYHAPLLYFTEEFVRSAQLIEKAIAPTLHRVSNSFDLIRYVWNGEEVPAQLPHVTLSAVYRKLDQALEDWVQWREFVEKLPDWRLKRAGVRRDRVVEDASQLTRILERARKDADRRSADRDQKIDDWWERNAERLEEQRHVLQAQFPVLHKIYEHDRRGSA